MLRDKFNYWVNFCSNNGIFAFTMILFRYMLVSVLVKHRFSRCGSINLAGEYQISGHKKMFIKSMTAGARLRLDALSYFGDQEYDPKIVIGQNFSLGTDVHIGCIDSIHIGDNVLVGSRVTIIDHDHGIYSGNEKNSLPDTSPALRQLNASPIVVGDNVFVGDGVIILKGARIEDGAVIAAGSVVTGRVRKNTVAVGNPAKEVKKFNFDTSMWENLSVSG